jgi:tetratricopeptide (TPR) repeat protein
MTRFAGIILLVLTLLLCARPLTAAETAQDAFARGNALYAAGQYADAEAAYQSAQRAGLVSANLYFNLGNAAYRQGHNGAAVLNYQRALILEPGHAEAAANLAFLRGASPATAEGSPIEQMLASRGANFWCLIAALAAWIALAAGAAAYFWRPWRTAWALAAVASLALSATSVGAVWLLVNGPENPGRAIVLADHTRAYYAPAENAKLVSTLSSGSSVRILSRQGPWTYAQLADGARAWLASGSVEKVIPAPF